VTEPLAFADGWVNALSDWTRRKAPWAWWPAQPPHPRQTVGLDAHAAYLAQLVALIAVIEAGWRRFGEPTTKRKLRKERGLLIGLTVIGAAITDGAWDRRAARRPRLRR
jgi:hypothetical protein